MKSLITILMFILTFALETQQRKKGNPLETLPNNIKILTRFSERTDFSPDIKSVAFITERFGDAMVIDIKTRTIDFLTCNLSGT